jgi:Zn-finger nucleic acid-binding protein
MKKLILILIFCSGCAVTKVHEQSIVIAQELCKQNKGIAFIRPDMHYDKVICKNMAEFTIDVDANYDPKLNRDKAIMDEIKSKENDIYREKAKKDIVAQKLNKG